MHAVVGLLEDMALPTIDYIGYNLVAAVSRKAVIEAGVWRRLGHHRLGDGVALEHLLSIVLLGLLPHRRPRVGVHGDRAGHRLEGTVSLVDTTIVLWTKTKIRD